MSYSSFSLISFASGYTRNKTQQLEQMSKVKERGDLKTRFKGKGLGTSRNQRPVGAVLPPEHDKIVRSIPNRSDWIREAIAEKLEREGLLPKAG